VRERKKSLGRCGVGLVLKTRWAVGRHDGERPAAPTILQTTYPYLLNGRRMGLATESESLFPGSVLPAKVEYLIFDPSIAMTACLHHSMFPMALILP